MTNSFLDTKGPRITEPVSDSSISDLTQQFELGSERPRVNIFGHPQEVPTELWQRWEEKMAAKVAEAQVRGAIDLTGWENIALSEVREIIYSNGKFVTNDQPNEYWKTLPKVVQESIQWGSLFSSKYGFEQLERDMRHPEWEHHVYAAHWVPSTGVIRASYYDIELDYLNGGWHTSSAICRGYLLLEKSDYEHSGNFDRHLKASFHKTLRPENSDYFEYRMYIARSLDHLCRLTGEELNRDRVFRHLPVDADIRFKFAEHSSDTSPLLAAAAAVYGSEAHKKALEKAIGEFTQRADCP